MKQSEPKVLVMVSDLHVGAVSGLLPPDFVTFEGNEVKQNAYQKWLWSCWEDCWSWSSKIIGKDPWGCAINGDAIDGNHHGTREIISPDTADHIDAVFGVLTDKLMSARKVYLTEGTNVHVNNSEHGIAAGLRGRGVKIVSPGRKSAWPELDLRIHGCPIAIDHHVSATTRSYLESGAYSATLADMRNRRGRTGWPIPKLVVRSHRHQYGMWSDGYGTMVVLPPWQGGSRFVRRVVPGAVPQCGMVIADWRNVPFGDLPTIHTRIHTVEQPTPEFL